MSEQAHAIETDATARLMTERRRHRRIRLSLLGRFMRDNRQEYPCRLSDISVGGAALFAPVRVEPGERIVAYFDQIGGLEGVVFRVLDDGFAMTFNATQRRREKLAAQLTWLINAEEFDLDDGRRAGHDRVALDDRPVRIQLADGRPIDCKVIDVSISGASLASADPPPIGAELVVGKLRSRVVRHHADGFGVAFLDIQEPGALRRHFV